THSFTGLSFVPGYGIFVPVLPRIRSWSPSPSRSAWAIARHQPCRESRLELNLLSLLPEFRRIIGAPQSETVTRSFLPSPSISTHLASVTIPALRSSYAYRSVPSVKLP